MPDLKNIIEDLAADFAVSLIQALRGVSIDEITALTGTSRRPAGAKRGADAAPGRSPGRRGRGGRLGRRSPADIGRMVDAIVTLLEKHPEGLRAEQIRASLDCQAKELPRPLADALDAGRIKKQGQKRATTYFAGDAAAGAGAGPAGTTTKRKGRGARRGKRAA